MQISVVTLMPELIRTALSTGVIGQALRDGRWSLEVVNPREFTQDVHHTVDDRVFGGSDGMLMMAEPLALAIEKVRLLTPKTKVIHLSPRGRKFTDQIARTWAEEGTPLTFVASRYAGVDERFIEAFCDDEISVGDFVVSGGDLPAALVIDAVLRHRPNVLGNQASAACDSFANGLFESRQYTRPREWRSREVPAVVLSGDPILIRYWQFLEALEATMERRPDLIHSLSEIRVGEIDQTLNDVSSRMNREQRVGAAGTQGEARKNAVADILLRLPSALKTWKSFSAHFATRFSARSSARSSTETR